MLNFYHVEVRWSEEGIERQLFGIYIETPMHKKVPEAIVIDSKTKIDVFGKKNSQVESNYSLHYHDEKETLLAHTLL